MGITDPLQAFLGGGCSPAPCCPSLYCSLMVKSLALLFGSRAWAERKRLVRLSWEFSDSFYQFTAQKIRWPPPCLTTGLGVCPAYPGVNALSHGLPTDAHPWAAQPHPLPAYTVGLYAESSNYLPKSSRIQDRDGIGFCLMIKLITFLCQNVFF